MTSRHYKAGGLTDFQFQAMDRFNFCISFSYDVFSHRLRMAAKVKIISYEEAYGAEAKDASEIKKFEELLCGDVPFLDDETDTYFYVTCVERNRDQSLVNKKKMNMRYNGLVAWALPVDRPNTQLPLLSACRIDSEIRNLHCIPMDPDDFNVQLHTIPRSVVGTSSPRIKKAKKDPDAFTPELNWKPSAPSSRGRRGRAINECFHH